MEEQENLKFDLISVFCQAGLPAVVDPSEFHIALGSEVREISPKASAPAVSHPQTVSLQDLGPAPLGVMNQV